MLLDLLEPPGRCSGCWPHDGEVDGCAVEESGCGRTLELGRSRRTLMMIIFFLCLWCCCCCGRRGAGGDGAAAQRGTGCRQKAALKERR